MASFKALCAKTQLNFDEFWKAGSETELHHFIGKDIVNFHGLFWPAMLKGAGYRTPDKLHVNGYLTVNGAKMSKSRGTFIKARTYLNHLNPEYLRYYFAAKLGAGVDDLDLNIEDFTNRINSDLVGKYINIASRCAGFIARHSDGKISEEWPEYVDLYGKNLENESLAKKIRHKILNGTTTRSDANTFARDIFLQIPNIQMESPAFGLDQTAIDPSVKDLVSDMTRMPEVGYLKDGCIQSAALIAQRYESGNSAAAIRMAFLLTDKANELIHDWAPWELAKDRKNDWIIQDVCTAALNYFRWITIFLKPVLPDVANKIEQFLNVPELQWSDTKQPLLNHGINSYSALINRIEKKTTDAMLAEEIASTPKENKPMTTETPKPVATTPAADAAHISIDDFSKIDLRIARIANAEHVEGADKLLRLTLDVGTLGTKQVFAGIKSAYAPETLVGRLTVMVANLAPRKMKFGMSEGMVLAASDERGGPFLLSPDNGAQPGMKVK
jgi:methionyl-tRNA synthetase